MSQSTIEAALRFKRAARFVDECRKTKNKPAGVMRDAMQGFEEAARELADQVLIDAQNSGDPPEAT